MSLKIESNGDCLTAFLSGDIDHHNAAAIRSVIDDAAQKQRPPLLRLDFADVSFMDSSGIGLVIGRYSLMNDLGGRVEAVNLSDGLYKLMGLAGMDKLVPIKKKEVTGSEVY